MAEQTVQRPRVPAALLPRGPQSRLYPVRARLLRRTTVFGAARTQLAARSWGDITMSDVARVAGVSRSSLYKEFGSREGFARALLISDAEEILGAVRDALVEHARRPADALGAAFEAFLTARSRSPLLAAAVAAGGGDLSALCAAPLDQLLERAGERLVGVIAEAWPAIRRRDAAPLAHGLLRLAIGFVVLPDSAAGDSPAALAALLAPYADIVTACAPCQGTQRGLT